MCRNPQVNLLPLVCAVIGMGFPCFNVCFGGEGVLPSVGVVASVDRGVSNSDGHRLSTSVFREEAAESHLAARVGGFPCDAGQQIGGQARVLGSLVSERVIVLSAGRQSGAVLGSLVSVGDGVVAKIVESRERLSAAVVEQGYKGSLDSLEGNYARLLVVRP